MEDTFTAARLKKNIYKKKNHPARQKQICETPHQSGVLLRERDRVVRPSGTPSKAAAGVRLRL
jgi:hypothetical protein